VIANGVMPSHAAPSRRSAVSDGRRVDPPVSEQQVPPGLTHQPRPLGQRPRAVPQLRERAWLAADLVHDEPERSDEPLPHVARTGHRPPPYPASRPRNDRGALADRVAGMCGR
jgi:hypothetical protein